MRIVLITLFLSFPGVTPVTAGDSVLAIQAAQSQATLYGKIEMQITGVDRAAVDPQDGQADLRADLESPSGRHLTVPAFLQQHFQREDPSDTRRGQPWLYPQESPVWTVRFSPDEVGEWAAVAAMTTGDQVVASGPFHFQCLPSDSPGYVRVSEKDPRYFEFSNGQPFFALGQNMAYVGETQYLNLIRAEQMLEKLAQSGVNYLRIWTCCQDWAMAIEAEKSAWSRSWSRESPVAPLPAALVDGPTTKGVRLSGRPQGTTVLNPTHPVALRPGTKYRLQGRIATEAGVEVAMDIGGRRLPQPASSGSLRQWRDFRLEFEAGIDERWLGRTSLQVTGDGEAWLGGLSLREVAGGPELLWEADVNRPVRGFYNPVDSFLLDQLVESAADHNIRLQLCLITRDLYMQDLRDQTSAEYDRAIHDAQRLLRYAVARWGYSTSVAGWEYFNENDPGLPTDRFYRELGRYLEQVDVYRHLRSTSTWHPSARDCRHPQLDFADVHFYMRPTEYEQHRDEVDAIVAQAEFLRTHAPAKPALIGEFGFANDRWMPTDEMKQTNQTVDLHNAIWASALSGTSGTALCWWWDLLDRKDAQREYRPLADFVAQIPWTTAGLQKLSAQVADDRCRVVGLQNRDRAYLWLFDPAASWNHTVVRQAEPPPVQGLTIEIKGLQDGEYRVTWWDTRAGQALKQATQHVADGPLVLAVPEFRRDIACKIASPAGH